MRHNRAVPRRPARVRPPRAARTFARLAVLSGAASLAFVGAAPPAPAAQASLAVSPAVVFSAAHVTCSRSGPAAVASSTQWLIDGAPVAGASSPTFTPPRSDDGRLLSCTQSYLEGGVARTLSSAGRIVHEQPPHPGWPISPSAASCAAPVCMQEGAAPGEAGEAYAQSGAWWGARQIRCVSAPWTSAVGDSTTAAVRTFAEAHVVGLELQRLEPSGPVTIASASLSSLGAASDALDAPAGPFGAAVVAPVGSQPFAAGELWSRVFPAAVGRPDWFAAGNGLLAYALDGPVARSFQLTYALSAGERGAKLRCVASAADGPASAATEATFAGPAFPVSPAARCAPRRLGSLSLPQPALLEIGDPRCVAVPSALPAVGGAGLQAIALKGNRLALELSCFLPGGCRGRLELTAGRRLAAPALRMADGGERLVELSVGPAAVRRVARAGHRGLPVTVTFAAAGAPSRTLADARLIGR